MGIRVNKLRTLRYEEGRHGRGSVCMIYGFFLLPNASFGSLLSFKPDPV